jgi:hypothetical protein
VGTRSVVPTVGEDIRRNGIAESVMKVKGVGDGNNEFTVREQGSASCLECLLVDGCPLYAPGMVFQVKDQWGGRGGYNGGFGVGRDDGRWRWSLRPVVSGPSFRLLGR